MKLHEKIYYCRKKAGLSQDALSERLGISRQAVSKWETGESVPETGKLAALAAALGVSVDWLLSEDEPEEDSGNSEQDAYGCFTGSRESYDSSRSRNQELGRYSAAIYSENCPALGLARRRVYSSLRSALYLHRRVGHDHIQPHAQWI